GNTFVKTSLPSVSEHLRCKVKYLSIHSFNIEPDVSHLCTRFTSLTSMELVIFNCTSFSAVIHSLAPLPQLFSLRLAICGKLRYFTPGVPKQLLCVLTVTNSGVFSLGATPCGSLRDP